MGWLDRLHKIATGVGGAAQAPFGLIKDLAVAPFRDDDEFDGLANTLYRRTVARGGQFLGNLLGPDEGVGAAVGAVPKQVRAPAGTVIGGAVDAFETAYREGIAEPISTAFTAASLADAPGGGGLGGLLRGSTWREAYKIAQHRSPGQAFAYAVLTKDVTDQSEVARVAGTDAFEMASGLADLVFRWKLDPTILAGKAAGKAREKFVVRPVRSQEDVELAMRSRRVEKFKEAIAGKSAAEIRHVHFPDHEFGAQFASALAEAGDDIDSVLRAGMGDRAAIRELSGRRPALASQIDRLVGERNLIDQGDTLFSDPARWKMLNDEIEELYAAEGRLARNETMFGMMRNVPRAGKGAELRGQITRSDWYQKGFTAAPLRVAFQMNPHRMVNVELAGDADVQAHRLLQRTPLELAKQDELRGIVAAATSPGERAMALIRVESAAVAAVARKAGMTTAEIDKVLAEAAGGRGRAASLLKSRVYDGEGRSRVRVAMEEGGGFHDVPLLLTQEANILPLVDMDLVRKAAGKIGRFRLRHPTTELPVELLNDFYRLWRPSVLLRVGWPIRVGMDEHLRILAKIGAMAHLKSLREAHFGQRAWERLRKVPVEDRTLPGGRTIKVRNYEVQGAFGTPGDAANLWQELVSAKASFNRFLGRDEKGILQRGSANTAQWRSIAPHEPDWGNAWLHDVNNQIGKDRMARMFLAGDSVDDVVRWLERTPEGLEHARRMRAYGRMENPRAWAETVKEQVDSYTMADPEIMQAALRGRASLKMIEDKFPDATMRPMVHGEILQQILGKGGTAKLFNSVVETGYKALGGLPTDMLARQPYFAHLYKAEVERLVNLLDDGNLTHLELDRISRQAREYALGETRTLLYDLAESSRLSDMVKFFMPFYSAWQEVLTRWAGLIVENPAVLGRARQLWSTPDKMGLVEKDEDGNEWIVLRIPEWVDDIPGLKALGTQGGVRFNKEAFSLALQGTPGFGPVVQIPVNEVVKDRPDLTDTVKWILPFGSTQSVRDMLLPATARRLTTMAEGDENREYLNVKMRMYFDKWVDFNLGKREKMPSYEEVTKDAQAFYRLRFWASFMSPAAPSFISPYQPYIDAYRALREADPVTADDKFLEQYGPDFFPLTQTLSKSVDGVPPTLEGWASRKKYRDLIEAHPELGGLIVGAEGAGEFNRAVYDGQLANQLRPGSGLKQRETPSFEESAIRPEVRLGWIYYGKLMDRIEAERIARGLPNLQVKAAQDLAFIKRTVVDELKKEYKAWGAAFDQSGRATGARVEAMRTIAADPRLAGRDDIRGLSDYFELRDRISAELASRKAKTLTAASNQDLKFVFDTVVGQLVDDNLAFGQLYYRWLEHDRVEAARGD